MYDYSDLSDSDYAQLTSTQQQFGCRTWSNLPGETIGSVSAVCTVANNVVCVGNRTFAVPDIACIKSVTRITGFVGRCDPLTCLPPSPRSLALLPSPPLQVRRLPVPEHCAVFAIPRLGRGRPVLPAVDLPRHRQDVDDRRARRVVAHRPDPAHTWAARTSGWVIMGPLMVSAFGG